jgi:hypothetical protein
VLVLLTLNISFIAALAVALVSATLAEDITILKTILSAIT